METKIQDKEAVEDILKQINSLLPHANSSNSMTTTNKPSRILWRPNNYRRKLRVRERDNSTVVSLVSAIQKGFLCGRMVEHTRLFFFHDFEGFTLQLGRCTLTAIYGQPVQKGGGKEVFLIERDSVGEVAAAVLVKKNELRDAMDLALGRFCNRFNIGLPFEKPVWDRYEDWVKGEEFVDSLPKELVIHDSCFKKVYGVGVEFKGSGVGCEPAVFVKNYIKNRALEDFSPEIVKGLNGLAAQQELLVNGFLPAIAELKVNLRAHVSVMRGIDRSFKRFNRLLSERQKTLGGWL